MTIPTESLVAILKRAAHMRIDTPPGLMVHYADIHDAVVFVWQKDEQNMATVHVKAVKCADQAVGVTLDGVFGPEPPVGPGRAAPWVKERERWFGHTPEQIHEAIKTRRWTNVPAPAAKPADEAPVTLGGVESPHESNPAEDPAPVAKMTRAEMVKAGMTKEQRHQQYHKQGGKHPDD